MTDSSLIVLTICSVVIWIIIFIIYMESESDGIYKSFFTITLITCSVLTWVGACEHSDYIIINSTTVPINTAYDGNTQYIIINNEFYDITEKTAVVYDKAKYELKIDTCDNKYMSYSDNEVNIVDKNGHKLIITVVEKQ